MSSVCPVTGTGKIISRAGNGCREETRKTMRVMRKEPHKKVMLVAGVLIEGRVNIHIHMYMCRGLSRGKDLGYLPPHPNYTQLSSMVDGKFRIFSEQ